MKTFLFPSDLWQDMRARLERPADETCSVLLTRPGATADDLLVWDEILVPDGAYDRRSPVEAELAAAFVFQAAERARDTGAGLLFVHTHPRAIGRPDFSDRDEAGEARLKAYLDAKLPGQPHASLIVAPGGCRARLLMGDETIVKVIGTLIRTVSEPGHPAADDHERIFDRQARAFGAEGQRLISQMKVGIIGVGGTGSVCAQQLAYLGVRRFVLIDGKVLDETNLNRVVGAEPGDIGRPKVDICRRMIDRIIPRASVDPVQGSVLEPQSLARLAGCDFVFFCTDNHTSRLVASRFCYRNYVPAIDVGVAIGAEQGKVVSIAGRVQMISPGLPCLLCTNSINADAVRREGMSPEQQAADPYFGSGGEPQPAVISLNSTLSSLAVTMFASVVTGLPIEARHLRYDARRSKVYPVAATAHPECLICSSGGEHGQGEGAAS